MTTITKDFPSKEPRLNEGASLSLPRAIATRWPLTAEVLAFYDEVERRPCLRRFQAVLDGAPTEHSKVNPYSTLEGRLLASVALAGLS